MLERTRQVRSFAGITRTADLTRLDRIGLPVFQAVRPLSRSLSVHQGKGKDAATAELSAVMEAIESHAAECVAADGPVCRFDALPRNERAADFLNYGERDPRRPSCVDALRWLPAENLITGGNFFVPFDLVSQDFTFRGESPFVRSSLGLASGASLEDATRAAFYELIEREVQAAWLGAGIVGQASVRVDPASIELEWFRLLSAHLGALDLRLSVYALKGRAGLPVVMCRIDEPGYAPSFLGAACRGDAGDALFRAFTEAAQSRLTIISGAREDIDADEPGGYGMRAFGTPPGRKAVDWAEFADNEDSSANVSAICRALAAEGVPAIARIDLSPPFSGVAVAKVIIPGLAGTQPCAN